MTQSDKKRLIIALRKLAHDNAFDEEEYTDLIEEVYINSNNRKNAKEAIYKMQIDCGRMGTITGTFIANIEAMNALIKSKTTIHFGEVLGKHSDVSHELESKDITFISEDPTLMAFVRDNGLLVGINPFSYIEEEEEPFDRLLEDLWNIELKDNGAFLEDLAEQCSVLYENHFKGGSKFKLVASGLNLNKHRWYELSTSVYKIYGRYLGVTSVGCVYSENMSISDVEQCHSFREVKPVTTVTYE